MQVPWFHHFYVSGERWQQNILNATHFRLWRKRDKTCITSSADSFRLLLPHLLLLLWAGIGFCNLSQTFSQAIWANLVAFALVVAKQLAHIFWLRVYFAVIYWFSWPVAQWQIQKWREQGRNGNWECKSNFKQLGISHSFVLSAFALLLFIFAWHLLMKCYFSYANIKV